MPYSNPKGRLRRLPQFLLFVCFIAWYFVARALATSAAMGLAFRFRLIAGTVLLGACFHLFLLVVGFRVLERAGGRGVPFQGVGGLPRRGTGRREWLTGFALGWGIVVVGLLPVVLLGRVHAVVSLTWDGLGVAALALAVLLVTALSHEVAFRGYPFRCLIGAVGESAAVVLMVVGAGVSAWHHAWVPGTAVIGSMLVTLLLSITWLRTWAVWLAWGLHFGLVASASVLFGLPVGDGVGFSPVVRSTVFGPEWLTGGDFGPAAAVFSLVVLLLAIPVLYRVTREYAWRYTHAPIVAGGYEVGVAAPAAHVAMEQQAAKGPGLVQILATTPNSFSANTSGVPIAPKPDGSPD